MNGQSYKRGQVAQALWSAFAAGSAVGPAPKAFTTRIKRLLEIDRQPSSENGTRYAFYSHGPEGLGVDTAFSDRDTFCLAIGLELLDVGFKQQEVVFLLQHTRPELERRFEAIQRAPPAPRQLVLAEERPGSPSYLDGKLHIADCRIFMLVNKIEMTELVPTRKRGLPVIHRPVFLRGIIELREELHRMNYSYRRTLVLEIAELAVLLMEALSQAEPTRRGRR
jgi:hypothetical protein